MNFAEIAFLLLEFSSRRLAVCSAILAVTARLSGGKHSRREALEEPRELHAKLVTGTTVTNNGYPLHRYTLYMNVMNNYSSYIPSISIGAQVSVWRTVLAKIFLFMKKWNISVKSAKKHRFCRIKGIAV